MSITKEKKYDESGFAARSASAEDLDQYGVWVKAGPETVEDESTELEGFELADLSDETLELTTEEEDLLGSLENKGASDDGELSLDDMEDFTLPESVDMPEEENLELLEEPTSDKKFAAHEDASDSLDIDFDLKEEKLEAESPLELEEDTPVEFNDLEAVERDMSEPSPAFSRTGNAAGDILAKIELELASIKEELAELKRELSILKPAGMAGLSDKPGAADEAGAEEVGFFEEDEDETIALTGDELDNILNTADITEEKGESDILPEDLDIDIKPEGDIISLEEPTAEPEPVSMEGALPGTTPEELAIIEEYNRELDNFGSEEFHIEEEDALDAKAVSILPDEGETTVEELELEEVPADSENVEFDLESLESLESLEPDEAAEVETSAGFEDDLEEIEIIPSEETEEVPAELEEETPVLEMDISEADVEVTPIPPIMKEPESPKATKSYSPAGIPENLKDEVKSVLKYMDQLLEALPEEKIQEFAHSEHFEVYRKLFEELGLE